MSSFTHPVVAALTSPLLSVAVVSTADAAAAAAAAAAPPRPLLATHSGSFHCDEALACGLLQLLPAYAGSPIVRSRVPAELARAAVVVDVGAEYDAARGRFDHHQASFTTRYRDGECTKLSSAGLVYKHHGADVIRVVAAAAGVALEPAALAKLTARTYDHFILEIDAIDNGVEVCDTAAAPLRYRVGTGLSARVGKLQPGWNEAVSDDALNARFVAAMHLAATEFVESVHRAITSWLPAREVVVAARGAARGVHPSGAILALSTFCPWKEHLHEIEADAAAAAAGGAEGGVEGDDAGAAAKRARSEPAPALPPALYLLYQDTSGGWRVQAVPVEPESFASRRALPRAWRGLRDAELCAAAGIADGVFVHAAGFIGGAKSYEGALALASKALELE